MVNGAWQPITYNHYHQSDLTTSTGKKLAISNRLGSGNTSFSVTFNARS